MKHALAIGLALSVLVALPGYTQQNAAAHAGLAGRWITQSGNFEIDIAPCGTAFCGKVVKVLANTSMSAMGSNTSGPDTQAAMGMTILMGLQETDAGKYSGEIYNRENGKTYRTNVSPVAPDQLSVHSYVGLPLFGKTQIWLRPKGGN
jgi:uncharacterized protein (DUF2147 family)